jgi:hypothetical protein
MRCVIVLLAWGCASTTDDSSESDDSSETDDTDRSPADTDVMEDTDTDATTDTDTDLPEPVAVSWRQVAAGAHPGSPGPVSNPLCEDVAGALLVDQDLLTAWGIEFGGGATLEYTVQWDHELAIGAWTGCLTTNHLIEFSKVEDVGGGELVVTCSVTTLANSEPFVSTAWGALAVEGLDWTSVSFVTEEKD